jgi:hypothetical protein
LKNQAISMPNIGKAAIFVFDVISTVRFLFLKGKVVLHEFVPRFLVVGPELRLLMTAIKVSLAVYRGRTKIVLTFSHMVINILMSIMRSNVSI